MSQIDSRTDDPEQPRLTHWLEGMSCCDEVWEQAYERFETPEEEVKKFLRRHRELGVTSWPRDVRIVELFCGRGNGLVALARLGFASIEGVDLSPALLKQYRGPGKVYVGDCRSLKFDDDSKDAVVVQGGLHHLPTIPDDLEAVLAESRRILKPGGRLVVVEPWSTPFLKFVHAMCDVKLLRRLWSKLDALALMTEREFDTYEQWLGAPERILELLESYFTPEKRRIRWGKLMFVGRKGDW